MGFVRGVLVVLLSVLLFVLFLVGNTFLTLGNSLEYDNIQGELSPVIAEMAGLEGLGGGIDENYDDFVLDCQNASEIVVEDDRGALNLSCGVVLQGPEAISERIIEEAINNIYYREYDCKLFDCNKQGDLPYFVISEHTKNYFDGWFYKSIFVIVILFVALLFLVEVRSNAFIISGILAIVASLPFSKLEWFVSLFDVGDSLQIFGFLFTAANSVFIKSLIFGMILLVIGIIWKFFSIGFKVQGFIEKFKGKGNKPFKKVSKPENSSANEKVVSKPVLKSSKIPNKPVKSQKVVKK